MFAPYHCHRRIPRGNRGRQKATARANRSIQVRHGKQKLNITIAVPGGLHFGSRGPSRHDSSDLSKIFYLPLIAATSRGACLPVMLSCAISVLVFTSGPILTP